MPRVQAVTDKFNFPPPRLSAETLALLKEVAELNRQLPRLLHHLSPEQRARVNRVQQLRREVAKKMKELQQEEASLDHELGGRWWDPAARAPATKPAAVARVSGDDPPQDDSPQSDPAAPATTEPPAEPAPADLEEAEPASPIPMSTREGAVQRLIREAVKKIYNSDPPPDVTAADLMHAIEKLQKDEWAAARKRGNLPEPPSWDSCDRFLKRLREPGP
jgi:hypothetical protein